MSEALEYLFKVRPDAMQAYFEFIKKSGTALDPKTRAIISVITKIDNQTKKGFKQYLKRALKQGVSANELIDAILVAFPTLGLSKIVWAMDILIEMDLPEFNPDNLVAESTWHDVMDADDIDSGETKYIEHNNRGIFIHKTNDNDLVVFDHRCPHQSTSINCEALDEKVLTCPGHGWKFDITNGECIEKGNRPLNRIRHKIENNRLLVYL